MLRIVIVFFFLLSFFRLQLTSEILGNVHINQKARGYYTLPGVSTAKSDTFTKHQQAQKTTTMTTKNSTIPRSSAWFQCIWVMFPSRLCEFIWDYMSNAWRSKTLNAHLEGEHDIVCLVWTLPVKHPWPFSPSILLGAAHRRPTHRWRWCLRLRYLEKIAGLFSTLENVRCKDSDAMLSKWAAKDGILRIFQVTSQALLDLATPRLERWSGLHMACSGVECNWNNDISLVVNKANKWDVML